MKMRSEDKDSTALSIIKYVLPVGWLYALLGTKTHTTLQS